MDADLNAIGESFRVAHPTVARGIDLLALAASVDAGLGGGGGTALSAIRETVEGETFYHYSMRMHAGSLAKGLNAPSFATSEGALSAAAAKSGLALPREAAPDAVYIVTPKPGTLIQVNGATGANFGQLGGLPEYKFFMGTGPGTVSRPFPIR